MDNVVAQDGIGRYRTVSEAVARAPIHSKRKYVIHVKRGIYHENVEVRKKKTNIMFVGAGMGETVISGSRSFSGGWTTFRSATFRKYMTVDKAHGGRVIAMHYCFV